MSRIKTCEVYVRDKYDDTREYIKNVDIKASAMATKPMIEKLQENEKLIKQNF